MKMELVRKELESSRWHVAYSWLDVRSDRDNVPGMDLYAELSGRGLVNDWRELTEIPIGSFLGMATSRYYRTA